MAASRFTKALSLLSLAAGALAAPLSSLNEANILERSASSSVPDICSASSNCIPFTIDVTWGSSNPTGAGARGTILTNGTFPGPALRLMVGECVDFLVINNLAVDTSVHFHGIDQSKTPWADGTPGVSNYPIKPGQSYMYQWTAEEQGAYFYHSHYKGQMMDGLYGAIYIMPANGAETPYAQIDSSAITQLAQAEAKNEPLFVSDYSKYTFDEFFALEQAGNVDIACADAIIINGLGNQYCLTQAQITAMTPPVVNNLTANAGYTGKACLPANTRATEGNGTYNLGALPADVFNVCTTSTNQNYSLAVDPADVYASMTFINPGGFTLLKATIDNHKLIVYAYNGIYVTPQVVDQITIGNGERVSVFIKLDQPVADYTIRVSNEGLNQLISGFGVLSYKGATGFNPQAVPGMSFGGVNLTNLVPFAPALAAPIPTQTVGVNSDKTIMLDIQKLPQVGHPWQWTLEGNDAYSMDKDDDTPLLVLGPAAVPESDLVFKTNYGQWVDLVIVSSGPLAQPHPLHKHGNKFFVLGQGVGPFTWSSVLEAQAAVPQLFNLVNPPWVDGYITVPGQGTSTWTVFRYKVENPGAWFFHCHIQTHLAGGMAVAIMDAVDKWPVIPSDVGQICQGSGTSNSSWNPSCYCPASCPANPSTNTTSSGTSNGGTGSSVNSNPSPTSPGGSWSSGVWSGSNNPAASPTASYSPDATTGSYTPDGSKSTNNNGTSPVKTYTGNAPSSSRVSVVTVLALVVAALML